jgi:dipeptidyl aminopeptidase/acylaminoacyl peptidase
MLDSRVRIRHNRHPEGLLSSHMSGIFHPNSSDAADTQPSRLRPPRVRAPLALAGLIALGVASAQAVTAQAWTPDGQSVTLPGAPIVKVDVTALPLDRRTPAAAIERVAATVVPGAAAGTQPAWSPDGTKLAYLAGGSVLTIAGPGERSVSAPAGIAISPAAWSPDSKFLAYVRRDKNGDLQVCTLHDNGDVALSVALPIKTLATGSMVPIAWVPTTDNIVVAGGDGNKVDLYLIDQGQAVQLTTGGDALAFAVSATGDRVRWIMRSRNTHYILFSLYDLALASRAVTKLPFPDRVPPANPSPGRSVDEIESAAISPDLGRIAFVARGGQAGADGVALYVIDSGGKQARLVSKAPIVESLQRAPEPGKADDGGPPAPPALPLPLGANSGRAVARSSSGAGEPPIALPVFSPDSRKLAYVRTVGDVRTLSILQIDAKQSRSGILP